MMRFLKSIASPAPTLVHIPLDTHLNGARLTLRMPHIDDWKAWHSLRETSRDYLEQWEPKWPDNALSYSFFCSLLRRQWHDWRDGKAYAFSILLDSTPTPTLIGGVTLSEVKHSSAQKGTVGYWIGKPYSGHGYMTEAMELVCKFASEHLGLQRLEASCLPNNEASKVVLTRTGFEQEGYAKSYLQINGKREDHLLWGKTLP